MSSGDQHDNSSTALLQPDTTDPDKSGHEEDGLVATDKGQQQQPATDQSVNTGDKRGSGSDVDKVETKPAELKIENESEPEKGDSSEKSADAPAAAAAATESGSAASGNHDARGEGDKAPIAAESSRRSRIQARFRSIKAEKVRMATSIEDIRSLRLWKGVAAEFLGTLLLTFAVCGSCIDLKGNARITSPVVQIALCVGLSVATIVWAIGHVSGGHINPAVTVAMVATRKISLAKAAFFIIFQLIGAVIGAGLLYGMTPSDFHGNLGATLVSESLNAGQALGVEIMITFVLVFVVFASVDSKRRDLNGSTPLTIGLSVTMCHLFAIDYTGSSMNTARSFGPALVMGKWDDHWVYWLGPILGGVLAGLLYDNVFAVNASLDKAKACLLSSDYDDDRYQAQKMKIRILEEDPADPKEEAVPLSDKTELVDEADTSNV